MTQEREARLFWIDVATVAALLAALVASAPH